jgi:hypothetical protein
MSRFPPKYLSLPAEEITAQDAVSWLKRRLKAPANEPWLAIFDRTTVSGNSFINLESHLRLTVPPDDCNKFLFGNGKFLRTWTSLARLSISLDSDFGSLRFCKTQKYLDQISEILVLTLFAEFPWPGVSLGIYRFRTLTRRLTDVLDAIREKDPKANLFGSLSSFWNDMRRFHCNIVFGVTFIQSYHPEFTVGDVEVDFIDLGLELICRALERDAMTLSTHLSTFIATAMASRIRGRWRKAITRVIARKQLERMRTNWPLLPRHHRNHTFKWLEPQLVHRDGALIYSKGTPWGQ